MIVDLGIIRSPRQPVQPPDQAVPPEPDIGPPYLASAEMIADLVGQFLGTDYRLTNHDAAASANGRMDPAQRLYEIDYRQAAQILAGRYPSASEGAWLIHLKNNMGWRLVPVTVCRYGFVVDPLTRQCVAEAVIPEPPVDANGAPPVDANGALPVVQPNGKDGKPFEIPIWGYALGIGLIVFVLAQPR